MRKIIALFLSITLILALVAGGNTNSEMQRKAALDTDKTTSESSEPTSEALPDERDILGKRTLVAYFSWADNAEKGEIDAITSASVTIPGNVAQLAAWVAEETNGDLFSIQVVAPYPSDWNECLMTSLIPVIAMEAKTVTVAPPRTA